MSILVPAALIFSAIIPIILLLYFMRPKRQERVVGSTLLWQQALQDLQASRPWQKLRITPLLLLQLLAALVIVLVLTRPAIFSSSPLNGNTIIVLQASASMQAKDVAPDRFESAKNSIQDLIDTMGPGDRLSLILMARDPQVLVASTNNKAQLTTALQRARVTNQDADLEQALALATSLAEGQSNTQVLVVGDGHVTNPDQSLVVPFPVRYLQVGTDAPNTALMALDARVVQGQMTAFAQITNFSHQQRSIPVELYADNQLVGVQTITLASGATGALQWTKVPPTARFLHARLLSQDAMTAGHDAWSIVGSSLHGRVLLVTPGNRFLETALRLQPSVELYETTPDKYANVGTYDLTVFDSFVPPTLPHGAIFFVNPPAGSYPFGSAGPEIKVTHIGAGNDNLNLLSDVDLGSIHVLHASHQLKTVAWASPIITTPETTLLAAGENNAQRIAVLGFDLHDSDLPLQLSFPILIRNLTNWFLPSPVPGNGQVTPGTPVSVQAWPGTSKILVTSPDQKTAQVGPPASPFANTDQLGIYQVVQTVRGQQLQGAFTVNLFDPAQSNLAPAAALPVLHSSKFVTTGSTVSHELREIWPWIAGLLLLILCAEWWLFSRSYRQQTSSAGTEQRKTAAGTARRQGNGFVTTVQDQLEEQYYHARKRVKKTLKRTKSRLTQRKAKGDKRANI